MPEPVEIAKAVLVELKMPEAQPIDASRVVVQFNPESLKVSFANQVAQPAGGDKPKPQDQKETAGLQFVGKGSTKLSVQLWFDAAAPLPNGALDGGKTKTDDVRELTKRVGYFITPQKSKNAKTPDQFVAPAVRFQWGTFRFDGIVEGMEEALEFFSPEGRPLRASVTLNMTQQTIEFAFAEASPPRTTPGSRTPAAGTQPLEQAPRGASLQSLAETKGLGDDWQKIAAANGIENPRLLQPGQLINFNISSAAGSLSLS
jgi:hypothetical protein